MERMKTASFTVHATAEQSARWKRAAEAEGHRSAGTWLAAAAESTIFCTSIVIVSVSH